MSQDLDVFGKEKRFERLHAKFTSRKDENGKDIVSYVMSKKMNISPRRLLEYYTKLGAIEPALKGKLFRNLTKAELSDVFAELKSRDGLRGKITTRSLNNYKEELKAFLKFLGKNEEAASIKNDRMSELNSFTAEDMLTAEEMSALLRAAKGPRNKAIIALLAETGMRPSELFNIQIKDVNLSSQTKTIIIFGKKRKRLRPILICIPYLAEWLNVHPQANKPDAPLFVKRNGKPVAYWAVLKMIKEAFARAGINKPSVIKLFRHSVNTSLYGNFPEEIVRQLQGHVPGSQMARHYSHLNTQKVNDAYLSIYGIKPQDEAKPLLTLKNCVVCGMSNKPENMNCERCKNPLTIRSSLELANPNKLIDDVLNSNSELLKQLEDKLTERVMEQVEARLKSNRAELREGYGGTEI